MKMWMIEGGDECREIEIWEKQSVAYSKHQQMKHNRCIQKKEKLIEATSYHEQIFFSNSCLIDSKKHVNNGAFSRLIGIVPSLNRLDAGIWRAELQFFLHCSNEKKCFKFVTTKMSVLKKEE